MGEDRDSYEPRGRKSSGRNTLLLRNFDDVSKAVNSARGALKVIGVLLALIGSSSLALGSFIVTTTLRNQADIATLERDVVRVEQNVREHANDDDMHNIAGLRDEMRALTAQLQVANTELHGSVNALSQRINRLDRDIDQLQRISRRSGRGN